MFHLYTSIYRTGLRLWASHGPIVLCSTSWGFKLLLDYPATLLEVGPEPISERATQCHMIQRQRKHATRPIPVHHKSPHLGLRTRSQCGSQRPPSSPLASVIEMSQTSLPSLRQPFEPAFGNPDRLKISFPSAKCQANSCSTCPWHKTGLRADSLRAPHANPLRVARKYRNPNLGSLSVAHLWYMQRCFLCSINHHIQRGLQRTIYVS